MGHGTHIFGYIQTLDDNKKLDNQKTIKAFEFDDPWPFINAFGNVNEHYWGGMISYGLHMKGDEAGDVALWLRGFHKLINKLDDFSAEIHVNPEWICPPFYRNYYKQNALLSYKHYWKYDTTDCEEITEAFDPFLSEDINNIWEALIITNNK